MNATLIERLRTLSMEYEEAIEQAKRFPDTKKGLRFYLAAAAAQFELSTLTTENVSNRHRGECMRLLTLITSEMKRLNFMPAKPVNSASASESRNVPQNASSNTASKAAQPKTQDKPEEMTEEKKQQLKELENFDPASTRVLELPSASFEDYGKMDPAVESVVKALETAYKRQQYERLGNQMPTIKNHVLLVGPPGGGKSHFCRAIGNYVISKFDSPFYLVQASDVKHSHVGVSEKRVRALFDEVKKNGGDMPVVVIDEIDSLCPSRDSSANNAAHVNSLVTEFLQCIDGVDGPTNAIVVGATNYPWKVDKALRSRLSNNAYVGLPSKEHISDYLNKNIRIYLGKDEAYIKEMLDLCSTRLENASYRNLGWFRDQVSIISFNATIEMYPDDVSRTEFVPISRDQLNALLERAENLIEYDENYIKRLQDPDLWHKE